MVLGNGTFQGCKELRRVTFREGSRLKKIGTFCFAGSGLEEIGLPKTLKTIAKDAFKECSNLRSIELPDNLEEIGVGAFSQSGLESIMTPPSVRVIHQNAFCYCKRLKKTMLNEGLEVLGTDEYTEDDKMHCGVFEESALEYI